MRFIDIFPTKSFLDFSFTKKNIIQLYPYERAGGCWDGIGKIVVLNKLYQYISIFRIKSLLPIV